MGPRFVGWVKYNVPNDSMCVGHGWSLCPTYAVGNTNSLIFASAGMTRLPSRYEAPPRKVACEALPQNNTLQNTQGGAMLTSFRGRATERVWITPRFVGWVKCNVPNDSIVCWARLVPLPNLRSTHDFNWKLDSGSSQGWQKRKIFRKPYSLYCITVGNFIILVLR